MNANGMLFLSKTPPIAKPAADGEFVLTLFAFDRLGVHRVEPWTVIWSGEPAEQFWKAHQAALRPGCAIEVKTQRMRAHAKYRAVPEIQAKATAVELVSTPSQARPSPSQSYREATA